MINSGYTKVTVLALIIILCYLPGLSGTFLLDDFGTLSVLSQWGSIDTLDKLYQYVFGGYTGPTGRPIPLLTFFLNSNSWPADAYGFLVFNLIIHVVNVFVLYWFLTSLISSANIKPNFIPIVVSIFWGLHPLNVSTVLYVVQRMTLLSTFFSLLTFAFFLAGYSAINMAKYRRAFWIWMFAVCTSVMAVLSKENAVLIPLQLLLINQFLIVNGRGLVSRWLRSMLAIALWLSSAAVIYKLCLFAYPDIYAKVIDGRILDTHREFNFFERLLTEIRVVGGYISSVFVPEAQSSGVFFDGYRISRSLFDPISTAVWFGVHVLLILAAFVYRKRCPLFSFGLCWFYIGHLVESTVVMLELKFEHRNYLPSIGLMLVFSAFLNSLLHRSGALRCALFFGWLALSVSVLVMRTTLWGQPEKAALVWIAENPDSTRALEHAALIYDRVPGNDDQVAYFLRKSMDTGGATPAIELKYYVRTCQSPENRAAWGLVASRFKVANIDWQIYQILEDLLNRSRANGGCVDIRFSEYNDIINNILANAKYQKTAVPILMRELKARAALIYGDNGLAVKLYMIEANQNLPLSLIMRQSLWLASYGNLGLASEYLAKGIRDNFSKENKFLIEQAADMKAKIDSDISLKNP